MNRRGLWMLVGAWMTPAFAHQGRPLTDPTTPLWMKGLLVLLTALTLWGVLRASNRLMAQVTLPSLWLLMGSGAVFAALMVFMLQTPQVIPPGTVLLVQQNNSWTAHQSDGSHQQKAAVVPVGQMITLQFQPQKSQGLLFPDLGVRVDLTAGQAAQVMLVIPARGKYPSSDGGLVLWAK